jgi:hypothetical protein
MPDSTLVLIKLLAPFNARHKLASSLNLPDMLAPMQEVSDLKSWLALVGGANKCYKNHLKPGVAEQRIAIVSAEGGKAPVSDRPGLLRFILIFLNSGAFGYTTKCCGFALLRFNHIVNERLGANVL